MKKVILSIALLACVMGVKAQDEKSGLEFSVGADVVSSYVWRGAYQTGASIQPSAGLSIAGLSLSAWGSTDLTSDFKEVDFTLGYEVAGLSLAITDYWAAGQYAYKYLLYDSHRTAHTFEFTVGYTLPVKSFPLSLSWNTFFAGSDAVKSDNGKRAYSSYFEATYPFSVKSVSLEAGLGLTPWEGAFASDFSVINLSLKASKEIKITDSFSLPLFGQLIANPRSEDIFFVVGVSF